MPLIDAEYTPEKPTLKQISTVSMLEEKLADIGVVHSENLPFTKYAYSQRISYLLSILRYAAEDDNDEDDWGPDDWTEKD